MGKVELSDEQLKLVTEIKDAIVAIDFGRIKKAMDKLDVPDERYEEVLESIKDLYRS